MNPGMILAFGSLGGWAFLKMNMACQTIATSTTSMKFKYENKTILGILSTSLVDTSHVSYACI